MTNAFDFVNAGIADLAEALIAKGATPERACEVAAAAVMDKLATERPDIFEKYIRAAKAAGALNY